MSKLAIVMRREFLERVRSRWFLISTVLVPVLFGLIILLPLWLSARAAPSPDLARITILDASGAGIGKRVASALEGGIAGDTLTAVIELPEAGLAAAESVATGDVLAGHRKGYLVIGRTLWPEATVRYVGSNVTAPLDMERLRQVVHDEIVGARLRAAGMDPQQVQAISSLHVDLHTERLRAGERGGSGAVSTVIAFIVAFVLYTTIFFYGQIVLRSVMEEKQTRVSEVIVASVRPEALLFGKVLGVGAVATVQLAISVLAAAVLASLRTRIFTLLHVVSPPFSLPHVSAGVAGLLVAYFALGYVIYAALFAAIGSMTASEQDAQQVQMPIALLLVLTVTFIQPVIMAPDGPLAITLSIVPYSSPIIMPLRLSLVAVPAWQVAASLLTLGLGGWLTVWVAARVYRTGLLMYGKRPTLRELARWVRESA